MSARRGTIREVTLGLNGFPQYLGTIAATTTGVDNGNTGVTFTIPQGTGVYIETDAAVYLSPQVKTAATPPATTASMALAAGATLWLVMPEELQFICARTAAGTANVKVFKVS